MKIFKLLLLLGCIHCTLVNAMQAFKDGLKKLNDEATTMVRRDVARRTPPNPYRYIQDIERQVADIKLQYDTAMAGDVQARLRQFQKKPVNDVVAQRLTSPSPGYDCVVVAHMEGGNRSGKDDDTHLAMTSLNFYEWFKDVHERNLDALVDPLHKLEVSIEMMRLETMLLLWRHEDYAGNFAKICNGNFSDKDLFPEEHPELNAYAFFGFDNEQRWLIPFEDVYCEVKAQLARAKTHEEKMRVRQYSYFFQIPLMQREYNRFLDDQLEGMDELRQSTIEGIPSQDLVDLMSVKVVQYRDEIAHLRRQQEFSRSEPALLALGAEEERLRSDAELAVLLQRDYAVIDSNDGALE